MIIQNLSKSFANKIVIENLNAEIPKGKITALFGDSGKGKTTLLRIIAKLEKADGGTVDYQGNGTISMMFQENRLLPFADSLKNVTFVGASEQKATELLTELGLGEELHFYPAQLSGGMKRRVALARALAYPNFDILLLDEPFTGLDETAKEKALNLIKKEADSKTVILVTHLKEDALKLCDNFLDL